MEGLAYLVVIIFSIALFSGPFAIALTSHRLVKFLNSKEGVLWAIVNALRKIIHLLAITIGLFLGLSLVAVDVTITKIIGVYAIVLGYIALRREYFPDFFFVRDLLAKFGVSRKNGRSSGDDGHGPEGQH